ncbi:YidH family protein [Nocardioides sp. YIM B13467]|uniref:YidH family protein n=1 Tax=Nocardioides sp. YIM B13467 TaxID=3366294 RepID=UPI00366D08F5
MTETPSKEDPRHPHWVYHHGSEPDPRFTLANERTFLAWARTVLGLLAGAVALHSFQVPTPEGVRVGVIAVLVVTAILCTLFAMIRWARVERAMRERRPLPAFSTGFILAGALLVVGVLLGFSLVL